MNVKAWLLAKLKADVPLMALIGDSSHLVYFYPDDFKAVPLIAYSEATHRQPGQGFFDDRSTAVESVFVFDIYTRGSTSAIFDALTLVMDSLYFALDFAADVGEPDTKLQHKNCRYRRTVRAEDLI